MTAPTLDFWFEFASTYSYPAAMRIGTLATDAGVNVRFRPFLLGPIFVRQGWATSPFNLFPEKGRYMWRDVERICTDLALPFRRPEPFPQNGLLAARVALVGLASSAGKDGTAGRESIVAPKSDWGEDFCRCVYRAQFAEGRRIDDPQTLETILRDLEIDPVGVLEAAQSVAIKDKLRAATAEAQDIGIFGAPSFRTAGGELFWGNDRLETALAWARRAP